MSKIIFMGTPDFSTAILEMLIDTEEVIAVVTQPDRPVGRKRVLTPPPVKKVAVAHDIPVYQPEKLSGSAELETLLQTECDLIVTAAFGQLLPESLLEHPKFGASMYMRHYCQNIVAVHRFTKRLLMVKQKQV